MLELVDVYAGYDEVPVLFGVSLAVGEGEIVALVGANGAGKTTTMRAISGVAPLRQGRILLDGRRIDGLAVHAITDLGIAHVPEGRRLFRRLTVRENLLVGAHTRRDPQQRRRSFERVYSLFPRLFERGEQQAGTLSGGEQQMLAIGRALMLSPRLLILDEPSLGIAPRLVEEIFAALKRINADGATILLVEQKVVEALEVAHRGYVLQNGRICLGGAASDVLASDLVRQAYLGM